MKRKLGAIVLVVALAVSLGLVPAAPAGAVITTPDIVGLWHLDGNALDSSGEGNHGAVTGATFVSGKFDEALSFDGTGDHVVIADDDSLSVGTAVTVEAWIKPASVTGQIMVVGKWNDGYREYEIQLSSGKVRFYAYSSVPGTTYAESSTTLSVNTWYHVAGVYDGSTLQVYIDGSADGSSTAFTATIPNTTARLTIGEQYWGGVWWRGFTGLIDEVRVWDEALDSTEIAESASLGGVELTKELTLIEYDETVIGDDELIPPVPDVPIQTLVTFTMEVKWDNGSDLDFNDLTVKDRLGAELEIDSLNETAGDATYKTTNNRSAKVFITWDDFDEVDLESGDNATLTIVANTDMNPGRGNPNDPKPGKREYTSPTGDDPPYELNSGATLTFSVTIAEEEIWLVLTTDPLLVTASGVEDEDDD